MMLPVPLHFYHFPTLAIREEKGGAGYALVDYMLDIVFGGACGSIHGEFMPSMYITERTEDNQRQP